MGLDMWLYREISASNVGDIPFTPYGEEEPIILSNIKYIGMEICRWRKAYDLHAWFVENVQGGEDDCGDYTFSVVKLNELIYEVQQQLRYSSAKDEDEKEVLIATLDMLMEELRFMSKHENLFVQYKYTSSW